MFSSKLVGHLVLAFPWTASYNESIILYYIEVWSFLVTNEIYTFLRGRRNGSGNRREVFIVISKTLHLQKSSNHTHTCKGEEKGSLMWTFACAHAPGHNLPLLVRRTISALLGSPSQDGVWLSGSFSIHCKNCSLLHNNSKSIKTTLTDSTFINLSTNKLLYNTQLYLGAQTFKGFLVTYIQRL